MDRNNNQQISREEKVKKTAKNKEEKNEFNSVVLDLTRVTRVTKGGKQLRFRAVVLVGNQKGKIGLGVAKGCDVSLAVEKATRLAKKNLMTIEILGHTIPHEVEAKYKAAKVLLRPQIKGKGLVAGGPVRVVCHLAGIKDISSKLISSSRNKLNIARASVAALQKLKIKR